MQSSSARENLPLPEEPEPPPDSEAELLERAEREARVRLEAAASDLGNAVLDALELRRHVREHPLVSLGAGLVSGFVLGRPLASVARKLTGGGLLGTLILLATRYDRFESALSWLRTGVPGNGRASRR